MERGRTKRVRRDPATTRKLILDAAEKNGRGEQLQAELEQLFNSQNTSAAGTTIPATFLRVEATR